MHYWSLIEEQKLIWFLQEAQRTLKTLQKRRKNIPDIICVLSHLRQRGLLCFR